jgi:hypothetical protein
MDTHPLKLKVQSAEAETPVIRRLVFGVEGGQFRGGRLARIFAYRFRTGETGRIH